MDDLLLTESKRAQHAADSESPAQIKYSHALRYSALRVIIDSE